MESERSLPCLQEPTAGPYPESGETSPHPPNLFLQVKGKVVPVLFFLTEHHAMKVYWGSGGIAPFIL
jgi:hypothetical protein